jgi:hypothetical protein
MGCGMAENKCAQALKNEPIAEPQVRKSSDHHRLAGQIHGNSRAEAPHFKEKR